MFWDKRATREGWSRQSYAAHPQCHGPLTRITSGGYKYPQISPAPSSSSRFSNDIAPYITQAGLMCRFIGGHKYKSQAELGGPSKPRRWSRPACLSLLLRLPPSEHRTPAAYVVHALPSRHPQPARSRTLQVCTHVHWPTYTPSPRTCLHTPAQTHTAPACCGCGGCQAPGAGGAGRPRPTEVFLPQWL